MSSPSSVTVVIKVTFAPTLSANSAGGGVPRATPNSAPMSTFLAREASRSVTRGDDSGAGGFTGCRNLRDRPSRRFHDRLPTLRNVAHDEDSESVGALERSTGDPTPFAGRGLETRRLKAALGSKLFGAGPTSQVVPTVGRHTLLEPLGRGGMGVVYAAYDPQLDRKVAIKVLRTDQHGDDDGSQRLLAEAQTMAKLNHPHVVAVHDAGVSDGQVFVAMEYVEGGTLQAWCLEHPPSNRDRFDRVLDLLLQAARGLAAAHEADLIHRDLKPANMLIDAGGRLRVADFGLARSDRARMERPTVEIPTDHDGDASSRASDSAGTPTFMAPEQFDGHTDARSDQWSWCATAWEAAYGDNPFAGTTVGQLIEARDRGAPAPPTVRSEVPRWFHAVLARGLAIDPTLRHASMPALIRDLERRRDRRGRWISVGAVGSLIALGAWGWSDSLFATDPPPSPCASLDDAIAEVYDREALRAELAPRWGAPAIHQKLLARLDRFADDWTMGARAVCRTAVDEGRVNDSTPPLDAPDGALRCFRDARAQLKAIVGAVAPSDDDMRAFVAVDALPALDRCRHANPGATIETADGKTAALLLSRVGTLTMLNEHDEASRLLTEVEAMVDADTSPGLAANIGTFRAKIFDKQGDQSQALVEAARALRLAERSGSATLRADAWKTLADASFRDRQLDQAIFYVDRIDSIASSMGQPAWLRAPVARIRAAVAHLRGEHEQAREQAELAIAASSEAYGPDDRRTSTQRELLIVVLGALGRPDEALATGREVLAAFERHYGDGHPRTAKTKTRLGTLMLELGDLEGALEAFAQSYEELSVHPSIDPSDVVTAGFSYAQALNNAARFDESNAVARRTYARAVKDLGEAHPSLSALDMVLAANALDSKDYEAAIDAYRALIERKGGKGNVNTHVACINLADALRHAKRVEEAREQIQVCDAMVGTFAIPTPLHTANSQFALAEISEALGDLDDAHARFTEAAEVYKEHAPQHPDAAKAQAASARLTPLKDR